MRQSLPIPDYLCCCPEVTGLPAASRLAGRRAAVRSRPPAAARRAALRVASAARAPPPPQQAEARIRGGGEKGSGLGVRAEA